MKNSTKIVSRLVMGLIIAQLLVILLSWIIAAVMPRVPIRSLLNDGGIRWMFNSFTSSVMNPVVIWILLYAMVYGVFRDSGIMAALRNHTFRKRLALRTIIAEGVIFIALLLLLTIMPHAVLLSVSGSLITYDFFMGLVPTIGLFLLTVFITYGSITRNFVSVSSVLESFSHGISSTSLIWAPYFLLMLLVHSVFYVLMISL